MRSITFQTKPGTVNTRATLEWLAKRINVTPISALLKNSVTAYRIDVDLAGNYFTFIVDNDIAHHSMTRNLDRIGAELKAGYRDQWDMELHTVKVEKS